jgi:hypothetical protein
VDATGDFPQFIDHAHELRGRVRHLGTRLATFGQWLRGHSQPGSQHDKALLSAVVQLPLDPPVTTTGYWPRRRSPGTGWSAAGPIRPGAAIPPNPAGLYQ